MSFVYKIAETALEFEQIHELNYRTFAEEIPQHDRNESHKLVDKFHDENTYIICKKDNRVVGMIAMRSERPFSLDGKIGPVEHQLPFQAKNPVEIRLLAIEQDYRNGRAFLGLAQALVQYCLKAGYDAALISGTVREQKLYGQLGFSPFAQLTGTADAAFQPMYLTKETFEAGVAGRISKPLVNFLPGPATISDGVRKAMMAEPFSHRSSEFESLLQRVKDKLTALTDANYVQILQGTGTLANDVVAAQLSMHSGKGLILVNGEFGLRLTDHAQRFSMEFDTMEIEWGAAFDAEEIRDALCSGRYSWLWCVHCETSTGVLNDLYSFKNLCSQYDITLAVDCVSAIGTTAIDLTGVAYATGVSGKGLLSYTGLSFVFHNEEIVQSNKLPRYLDLGIYAEARGIPYTQSSNLVSALDVALLRFEHPAEVFAAISNRARKVRKAVEQVGLTILASEKWAADGIVTIALPKGLSAIQLGDNLFLNGFNVHYESAYLRERNWLQISCMNVVAEKELTRMLQLLPLLTSTDEQVFTTNSKGKTY
ncbi:aminotransferase class V-fold PLP-dependent enzyme [Sporosarcina sp. E16_8]|uniref:aminotransferase class V-fold PLP-dependent enzyme n=1 Tax=Sporosarcina sp. E16_8 TaxID=2789295 RepID=UPI001A91228D|nr:aminotransferase class V-fold PLP-dependent enzyme [Sporosarcina sp. E16_8]MBO0589331.1 aminotransferase class V-fold PLP-dependent enzyme [Sporosarcina sp. E16_8]